MSLSILPLKMFLDMWGFTFHLVVSHTSVKSHWRITKLTKVLKFKIDHSCACIRMWGHKPRPLPSLWPHLTHTTYLPLPLHYLHLKDFLKYECELYLKQPLTPPELKIISTFHTSNHRLVIEIGRWSIDPLFTVDRLCHFYSYSADEAHFVSECPL